MAKPIRKIFSLDKESLLEALTEAIQQLKLDTVAVNREMCMVSFRNRKGLIYYAQISPAADQNGSELAIAPGLSKLADRDLSVVDVDLIDSIQKEINKHIKNE